MHESELISRFLDGDVNAFNMLVRQWQGRIFNFSFKILGQREDAKDVTQKTFIKTYKAIRKLRDPNRFSTWIHQIAMNLCRDELRRRKSHFTVSMQDKIRTSQGEEVELSEFLPDDGEQPDDPLYQNEVADIIRRALKLIPEEQRIVIVMKEYQGLKFREIAEVLEEPLNTVKSRMYYGLSSLRKALAELDVDKEILQYGT